MSDSLRVLGAASLLLASVLLSATVLPAGTATAADASISIDTEGDAVTVSNAGSQVITGSADLAPGTEIWVRVQSTGDTEPRFFQSKTAVVDRDGTWAVAFDFAEQSANDTFSVTATAEDVEATADGEVVACDDDCADPEPKPVETVRIDTTDGTVVVNDSASQVISGSALAPTGTEVSLRIRSTDSDMGFFKVESAVVTEDGTWATAFNFSRIPAGAEFSVEATMRADGYVAERGGEVVACEEDCRDQPPTDTPTPIPTATPAETSTPAASTVEFARNVVQVEQGATARMELSFDDTGTAGLVIGQESVGYTLEATVRDADDDGKATVRFDTGAAGTGGDPITVSEGDEVVVEAETELPDPIVPGEYELRAFPGNRSVDDASDASVLFLAEPAATETGAPGTVEPTATPTGGTESGGNGVTTIVVSSGLVLGGGALALLLLRN